MDDQVKLYQASAQIFIEERNEIADIRRRLRRGVLAVSSARVESTLVGHAIRGARELRQTASMIAAVNQAAKDKPATGKRLRK